MLKVIIIYIDKKTGFNYKNNYKYYKLANFYPDTISKINFRLLIVMLYILSELKSRN